MAYDRIPITDYGRAICKVDAFLQTRPDEEKKDKNIMDYYLPLAMTESAWMIAEMFDIIRERTPLAKVAINIGANDGISLDLLHRLYVSRGWGGLCIDFEDHYLEKMNANLPPKVDKLIVEVTPDNVLSLLEKYKEIDAISVDIDSFDYYILEKVITLQPKMIIIEVNEDVPPGITYAAKYKKNFSYDAGVTKNYGCSLDAVTALGDKHGFKLLRMDWNNAILIREDLSPMFDLPSSNKEAYSDGYYNREGREKIFYWKGFDAKCFEMPLEEAYEFLLDWYKDDLDDMVFELTT